MFFNIWGVYYVIFDIQTALLGLILKDASLMITADLDGTICLTSEFPEDVHWFASGLDCCLDAFPFWLASAALESLESSLTDDYIGVYHYAALGIGFPSFVGTSPPPFCF